MARVQSEGVEVSAVLSVRDRREFLDLPYRLHRDSPNWVAPLRVAQKDILDTRRHPFYKTAQVEMFLARRNGRAVGRIMAIITHAHNSFHNERAGFFGFFEVEPDFDAALSLVEAARSWVRERGAEFIRGPFNPSPNYECGLLIDSFDSPPAVMMVWNPPYYAEFLERCGLSKAMDLYAYEVTSETFKDSHKLRRVSDRLKERDRITVRNIDMKNLKREVEIVRRIYNQSWSRNWSFVPVIEEEFAHLAKDIKQIADPRIAYIAEMRVDGHREPVPIGFFLAVPDVNQALKKIYGRLFPLGLFKLLWHSRRINSCRIIIMGIVEEHQNLGVASLFYEKIYREAPQIGYHRGEMSWVLENNMMMTRAAQFLGGRHYKTYRIFEESLMVHHN